MKARFLKAAVAITLAIGSAQGALAERQNMSFSFLNPASSRADELALYSRQLKHEIAKYWLNQEKFSVDAPVEVLFQIRPDGSLLSASIAKSSGVEQFDQQALISVKSCAPFQAPPLGE